MKILQSSLFRALCAVVVGALLVKYREQTMTWITVLTGVMFFVSGVFSCVTYFVARGRKDSDIEIFDAQGNRLKPLRPTFPIVGVGSLVLGLVLALMPGTFIDSLMYVLAAILILGSASQFASLINVSRVARIGFYFWIMPTLTLLIGIVAVVSPSSIATAPLFVIGWAMMVYGVVEIVNSVKIYQMRKAMERRHQSEVAEVEK